MLKYKKYLKFNKNKIHYEANSEIYSKFIIWSKLVNLKKTYITSCRSAFLSDKEDTEIRFFSISNKTFLTSSYSFITKCHTHKFARIFMYNCKFSNLLRFDSSY